MIRAVLTGCLLLGLAACATAQPDASQPVACDIEKAAVLPARIVGGALLVPASLDHSAVQMQVDTGAERTSVTPDAAVALGLQQDLHRTTRVFGTGGAVTRHNTLVWNFEAGGQVWTNQSFATAWLSRQFNQDRLVAGLFGADLLSEFDVELDLPRHRMTLWEVQGCSGDFAFRGIPHWRMPLVPTPPNRLIATVQIDGKPVSALIDWGANRTILKQTVAEQLGVTPAMLRADPPAHGTGSDRNEVDGRFHRFAEVRIGPGIFHQASFAVAPIHTQGVDMLLGLDYARTRRLWLSYSTDQLFVVPPRAAGNAGPVPPSHGPN